MIFLLFIALTSSKVPIMTEAEIISEVKGLPRREGYYALYIQYEFEDLPLVFLSFKLMLYGLQLIWLNNPRFCVVIDPSIDEPYMKMYPSGAKASKYPIMQINEMKHGWGSQDYGAVQYYSHMYRAQKDFMDIKKLIYNKTTKGKTSGIKRDLKSLETEKEKIINNTNHIYSNLFELRKIQRNLVKENILEYGAPSMKTRFSYLFKNQDENAAST
ncbi:hypothetical protein TVAG_117500 [Trichomonas vaginalis G3]|uniref:Uncharacterized protein n=1 Tax=Trichomonas vaginalis (strain ATCC PRA-98 / G3) TaxID=412133 RepID=A2E3U0_TRIV3|nr:hypothetical protein TVAGG3_0507150 [Trichomonas vaginalis G3]EAY12728.1 hypothetical protein TVAG_117500 [Trichomonas vaginalis G3]KAI5517510.1 hypothetical protein TVAGG3_0507150 [Trichomonas vaginalis G3]|eukprot:XP_001324951.1 hypothetical protein [Trichomonas vaginalis G3]